jgi:hypothetical protein
MRGPFPEVRMSLVATLDAVYVVLAGWPAPRALQADQDEDSRREC